MDFCLGVGRDPDGHSVRAPEFLCGERRTVQNDTVSETIHQKGLYGQVSR